jgi:hypothetical protein
MIREMFALSDLRVRPPKHLGHDVSCPLLGRAKARPDNDGDQDLLAGQGRRGGRELVTGGAGQI